MIGTLTGQKETDLGTGLVTDVVIGLGTCLVIGQGTGLVIGLMVDHVADLVKGHVTESGIAAAVAGVVVVVFQIPHGRPPHVENSGTPAPYF